MRPVWSPPRISRVTSPGITRMMRKTTTATPSRVGTISSRRLVRYVRIRPLSVLGEPDVLQLLVGVVVGRGHVVLHLAPVHEVPRPPEPGGEVGVAEHALLHLVDELLALHRVEGARLAREEIVHL